MSDRQHAHSKRAKRATPSLRSQRGRDTKGPIRSRLSRSADPRSGPGPKAGLKRRRKTENSEALRRLSAFRPPRKPSATARRRSASPSSAGSERSPLRAKEPLSPLTRRSRIPVALAAAFALVVLATNFPLTTLLSQHHQLSAEAAQLHQIQSSNRALSEQNQQLNSTSEIDRLARQDYQLVLPSQTLYDVLPASGKTTSSMPGDPTSGDPGSQPLVDPANAPDMSPDPGLPRATPVADTSGGKSATSGNGRSDAGGSSSVGGPGAASTPSSFWSRVANTLEFWK